MAPAPMKPRLGISACLLGQAVRWDGRDKRHTACVDLLGPLVEWVPVCPEVEVGLPVPRPPLRLVGSGAAPRLVVEATGEDWTARMTGQSVARVEALARLGLDGWVTKAGSPSCGLLGLPVHDPGGAAPGADGVGAFVAVLRARLPLLPIVEEGALEDPRRRELFLERVFAERDYRSRFGPRQAGRSR